jgi:hypothetical protein
MRFARLAAAVAVVSVALVAGCSSGSSSGSGSDVSTDLSSAASSPAPESSFSLRSTASDAPPTVPNGAVMAATVIVDSGEFAGTSKIQSTGTVGCSFNLFGDNQWRINFSGDGEFAAQDTTTTGRQVFAFGLATENGGIANLSISYTANQAGNDLQDQQGAATVQDNGSSATFTYAGRHTDGTTFHGAASCTKILRDK